MQCQGRLSSILWMKLCCHVVSDQGSKNMICFHCHQNSIISISPLIPSHFIYHTFCELHSAQESCHCFLLSPKCKHLYFGLAITKEAGNKTLFWIVIVLTEFCSYARAHYSRNGGKQPCDLTNVNKPHFLLTHRFCLKWSHCISFHVVQRTALSE